MSRTERVDEGAPTVRPALHRMSTVSLISMYRLWLPNGPFRINGLYLANGLYILHAS